MSKPRRRRRSSGNTADPDRQPANLDHRKGHRSLLRAGLPELQRGGRGSPRGGRGSPGAERGRYRAR